MCDFKPGDQVVCVDAVPSGNYRGHLPYLRIGAVYTIAVVRIARGGQAVLVELADLPWIANDGGPGGFRADRFRKVQKPKTDLSIETFLTIKPGFEEPRRPKAPARKRESV